VTRRLTSVPHGRYAALGGFDLHAGVMVRAGDRNRLKRLCRYTLRPPLALTRLRVDADGQVCIALRHPWSDGTTHLRFDPIALLERLSVLIPRPRINLVLYYGVLGPARRGGWPWSPRRARNGPALLEHNARRAKLKAADAQWDR
jgi:hypothetical protein